MIENYLGASNFVRTLFKEDDEIKELKKEALENKIPIVTEEVLAYMIYMLRLIGAKKGLEIGSAVGYSAYYLSKYVELTTIEIDKKRYEIAKKVLKGRNVKIYNADACEILKDLDEKYDFIFIDAAKGKYLDFFKLCYDKLNYGGLIFIDNILFRAYVCENEYPKRYKTIVKNLREFINYLKKYDFALLPFGDGIGLVRKEKDAK
ncbi:O-methyltransferase [Sneathia sanguinegens]|uniref:O-methyltransferase n=1 Tax=Sneathia sanguinegens TaxID=40543 RepID=A0ABT7HHW4_9FUSO|nr:O-methyltransferase [Sneathia sanguinegens]MDK9580103.1 O-methyltransferase [Sneathia sanguinegens]